MKVRTIRIRDARQRDRILFLRRICASESTNRYEKASQGGGNVNV